VRGSARVQSPHGHSPGPVSTSPPGQNPQAPDTVHTNHTRPTSKACRARQCTGSASPRSFARPSQHQPPVKTRKHQAPSSRPGLPPAPEPVHSRPQTAKNQLPNQPSTNPPPGEPGAAAPGPLPPTQNLNRSAPANSPAPSSPYTPNCRPLGPLALLPEPVP